MEQKFSLGDPVIWRTKSYGKMYGILVGFDEEGNPLTDVGDPNFCYRVECSSLARYEGNLPPTLQEIQQRVIAAKQDGT